MSSYLFTTSFLGNLSSNRIMQVILRDETGIIDFDRSLSFKAFFLIEFLCLKGINTVCVDSPGGHPKQIKSVAVSLK